MRWKGRQAAAPLFLEVPRGAPQPEEYQTAQHDLSLTSPQVCMAQAPTSLHIGAGPMENSKCYVIRLVDISSLSPKSTVNKNIISKH